MTSSHRIIPCPIYICYNQMNGKPKICFCREHLGIVGHHCQIIPATAKTKKITKESVLFHSHLILYPGDSLAKPNSCSSDYDIHLVNSSNYRKLVYLGISRGKEKQRRQVGRLTTHFSGSLFYVPSWVSLAGSLFWQRSHRLRQRLV